MSRKGHKLGGKYGGSHTTVIPLAEKVCDLACSLPQVSKIIPSFIKSGLKTGKRRVKIIDLNGNILLSIRDNMAHQEVIVYIKRRVQPHCLLF